jgi:hypothetical protein
MRRSVVLAAQLGESDLEDVEGSLRARAQCRDVEGG